MIDQHDFRWSTIYRIAAAPFGVRPGNSFVRVGEGELGIRFGPWALRTPLSNVRHTEVTDGYSLPKTAGPAHLSFEDRGITFATNRGPGLCICFHEPVRALDPLGVLQHPAATVTVADIDRLRRAVEP